jgi:hypothetical protein
MSSKTASEQARNSKTASEQARNDAAAQGAFRSLRG